MFLVSWISLLGISPCVVFSVGVEPALAGESQKSKKFIRRKDRKKLTTAKLLEKSKKSPVLLYIHTTDNCYCILARCKAGNMVIDVIEKNYENKMILLKLDHSKEEAVFDEISKNFSVKDLPAVLLFSQGEMIYKEQNLFNKKKIEKKLAELIKTKE